MKEGGGEEVDDNEQGEDKDPGTPCSPVSADAEAQAEAQSSMIEHFSYEANLAKQYQEQYAEDNEQEQEEEQNPPVAQADTVAPPQLAADP